MQIKPTSGFTPFSWALAIFCIPGILWPMALLLSASVGDANKLTGLQIVLNATFLWIYPLFLLVSAAILNRLHRNSPQLAKILLAITYVIFYVLAIAVIRQTFL